MRLLVMGLGYRTVVPNVVYTGGLDEVVSNVYRRMDVPVTIFVRSTLSPTSPTITFRPAPNVTVNAAPVKPHRGLAGSERVFRVAIDHADMMYALDFTYTVLRGYIEPTRSLWSGDVVLHCHDWLTAKMIPLMKQSGEIPGVFSVHMSVPRPKDDYIQFLRLVEDWGMDNTDVRAKCYAMDRRLLLEAEGCHAADLVHAVSGSVAREVRSAYGIPQSKIRVIPNGVDTEVFSPPAPEDEAQIRTVMGKYGLSKPFVLSAGRFVPEKGHRELILAFERFSRNHPEYQLAIFGFGGYTKDELIRTKNALPSGAEGKVKIFDQDVRGDMPYLLKACDIAAFPSTLEAFGIVACEAMSAGKPVVVGNTGGMKEIIDDAGNNKYGTRVNGGDPASIAEGLERAHQNREEWGRQAREVVEKRYSWDRIAQEYMKMYRELV